MRAAWWERKAFYWSYMDENRVKVNSLHVPNPCHLWHEIALGCQVSRIVTPWHYADASGRPLQAGLLKCALLKCLYVLLSDLRKLYNLGFSSIRVKGIFYVSAALEVHVHVVRDEAISPWEHVVSRLLFSVDEYIRELWKWQVQLGLMLKGCNLFEGDGIEQANFGVKESNYEVERIRRETHTLDTKSKTCSSKLSSRSRELKIKSDKAFTTHSRVD